MSKLVIQKQCDRCDGTGKIARADGAALKAAREQAGVTQREMARRTGLSAPYICDIEKGYRACPKEVLEAYTALGAAK